MATFEITAPDGKAYRVDGDNAEGAVNALHQMLGGTSLTPAAANPFEQWRPKSTNPFEQYRPEPRGRVTDPALLAKLNAPEPAPAAPAAPKDESYLRKIDDVVRALANGATFGLADRFAAAASSATGIGAQPHQLDELMTGKGAGNDYAANLERERRRTDQFAEEHPYVATGANLVGGIAVPLGAFGAAARGASLGTKTLLGAGAGLGIGAVAGAAGSKDWTDLRQTAKDAAFGAGTGALIGGAIPGTSAAVGAAYGKVMNAMRGRVDGMSRGAGSHLINAVEADGPAAVRARLDELGPDAVLGDAGPSLLGKLQGASLNSDEGRSIAQGALTTRNEGTNARIQSDVNRALGPAEDPQSLTDRILKLRAERDASAYPAALDNAPSVKIAPIMYDLQDRIAQTPNGSMERKALENLEKMLTTTKKEPMLDAGGYPVYDKFGNERFRDVTDTVSSAQILHKVKGELDAVINHDAPGLGVPAGALQRQQGALKQMRHALNDTLEIQVPGYKAANEASAALAKRAEAVQAGTQYLGSGKTTPSPSYFANQFQALSPDEMIAFQAGSRGNIDRVLGTKANDLQALRGELQGEGGWNTAKLATVHGQPAADELANSVDRNLAFRDTYNKVVENSQTAQRQAAAKAMKPDPSSDTPLINPNSTMTGMAATVGKKGVQSIINALTRSDPTRHYGEVARALTEQGAARDARLMAIVDALDKRQVNAQTGAKAGDVAALLGAIAANGALTNSRKNTLQ
jgi:hypothetical protein